MILDVQCPENVVKYQPGPCLTGYVHGSLEVDGQRIALALIVPSAQRLQIR
jgi:hypothetical protein